MTRLVSSSIVSLIVGMCLIIYFNFRFLFLLIVGMCLIISFNFRFLSRIRTLWELVLDCH